MYEQNLVYTDYSFLVGWGVEGEDVLDIDRRKLSREKMYDIFNKLM